MRFKRCTIKYIGCHIIIFLAGWFVFCPSILAAEVKGLREIYATPIPAEIRRNFDEYIRARETSPELEGRQGVVDGEKFIDIYTKKFLVIGLEPNSFGGIWAIIAVRGQTHKAFCLWLYDIESGVYDLRSVTEISGRFDTFGDKPQGLSLGTQSRSAESGKKPGLVALSVNTEDTHKANIKKTSPDACLH